jgi:hypothetical protein
VASKTPPVINQIVWTKDAWRHTNFEMNRISPFLVAVAMVATSGCISTHMVKNKAQPHAEYDPTTERHRLVDGQPGYYALLPLSIPADIATYPFQLIFFAGGRVSHSGRFTVDGWPVPLP